MVHGACTLGTIRVKHPFKTVSAKPGKLTTVYCIMNDFGDDRISKTPFNIAKLPLCPKLCCFNHAFIAIV